MLQDEPKYMPYAPAGNVLIVIQRLRQSGLKEVLTNQELARLGIPEGTTPRVTKALRFLGLVDDESRQTQQLQRLGRASSDDYPKIMAEVLEAAYEDIFAIVQPSTATDIQLNDAFRGHDPEGQRDRMVTLFLTLCREAGLVQAERVNAPRSAPARTSATKPRVTTRKTQVQSERQSPPGQKGTTEDNNGAGTPRDVDTVHDTQPEPQYQLLQVLLKQLPSSGIWTQKKRDQWLGAVTANIDLLIEIGEVEDRKPDVPQPSLEI